MTAAEGDRMTIGAFARATGLTASALRFYDDCGLVAPVAVDPGSGYRYYALEQVATVVLIRHLRALGLPLDEVRQLATAPAAVVQEAVQRRVWGLEQELRDARARAREVDTLVSDASGLVAQVSGAVLAAAIRQVSFATDRGVDPKGAFAVLAGVLIEIGDGQLRLVATDRYRLALRRIPLPREGPGTSPARRWIVPATQLDELGPWLAAQPIVELCSDTDRVRVSGAGDRHDVTCLALDYPDYRHLLDGLPRPTTQVIAVRDHLLAAVTGDGAVRCQADPTHGLRIHPVATAGPGSPGPGRHDAVARQIAADVQGAAVDITFDAAKLGQALASGAGPDVVLDLAQAHEPVVLRSADDGDHTTLIMPTRPPQDSRGAA